MVVTIEDRRVTTIPIELELDLHLEPYCCVRNTTTPDESLSKKWCAGCKLVSYSSRDCQKQDWKRHKKEDECVDIEKCRRFKPTAP